MKIQPLGNRLLVEEEKVEQKTESGIVLPDTAEKEKSQFGIIIAVGEGKLAKNTGLKKGDKVIMEKFGPTEVEVENKTYLIAEINHILAKVE